jgi:O-antigen/teichoic acid export membrane protein
MVSSKSRFNGNAIKKRFTDGSLTKKASLNALATGLDYGSRTIVGFLLQPLMVSFLGDFGYGVWQVLDRSVGYISPATGRPTQALKLIIARRQGSTDHEEKRRHIGSAVAIWLFSLPLMFILGGLLSWYIPGWISAPGEMVWPIRLATALLVLNTILISLLTIPKSVLEGENLGYKRMGLSTILVFIGGGLQALPLYLGWGLTGQGLASVAITGLTGVIFFQIARKQLPWFGIARPDYQFVRQFLGLSGWFQLWNLVMRAIRTSDVVLLGLMASPQLVTVYSFTRYVPETLTDFITTIVFGITPGMGKMVGEDKMESAAKVRTELMSVTWLLSVVIGAGVLLWNQAFIGLWTKDAYYAGPTANLLIILMVIQFSLIRNDASLIDLTLQVRDKVLFGIVATLIGIVISGALLYFYDAGIVGLCIGIIAGRLLLTIGYPLIVSRAMGIPFHEQLRGVIRPTIATAIIFGLAFMLADQVTVSSWLGLLAAGAVTTLVVLPVTFFLGLSSTMRNRLLRRFHFIIG